MFIFGGKFNLTSEPGLGRDYFDDRVPTSSLEPLLKSMESPSGGFRNYLSGVRSKFSWQKSPEFYEGMLCGLAMVGVMLHDLAQAHQMAQMIYAGVQGVVSMQAGVVGTEVQKSRKEKGDDTTGEGSESTTGPGL